jgi:ABC-2 type transport system ATP-binding protein
VTSASAVELRGVSKAYGAVRVLEDISLAVAPGEIFGYLGPNGAGKTTTIKLLTGLERPTSGDVLVGGSSVLADPLATKARVGYVPESGAVFERLTPREYLTAVGDLYRLPREEIPEHVEAWLARFDLSNRVDQRMDTFSKGMRQKVCIAAALIHDPEVLFLDEPLNGLDAEAVVIVKELLRALASEGRTVFYTSHIIDVVERLCTRIGVIRGGRLLGIGTVDQIRNLGDADSLEAALIELWRKDA